MIAVIRAYMHGVTMARTADLTERAKYLYLKSISIVVYFDYGDRDSPNRDEWIKGWGCKSIMKTNRHFAKAKQEFGDMCFSVSSKDPIAKTLSTIFPWYLE